MRLRRRRLVKGPGSTADAVVERRTGTYELTESRHGLVAMANDLHKGRDTGDIWKWLIDVSALLLTVESCCCSQAEPSPH